MTPEERREREEAVRIELDKMTPAEQAEFDHALDELVAALAAAHASIQPVAANQQEAAEKP